MITGSGALSDVGVGRGRGYQLNIPLRDGIQDDLYVRIFQQ